MSSLSWQLRLRMKYLYWRVSLQLALKQFRLRHDYRGKKTRVLEWEELVELMNVHDKQTTLQEVEDFFEFHRQRPIRLVIEQDLSIPKATLREIGSRMRR